MTAIHTAAGAALPRVAVAVAIALAATGAARAQDATSAAGADMDEVRVTASRVERSGFEAPTPTTMVGEELFDARAAVRVSQVLFEIPALRPTATAVPFSASAGGSYANLRSLNPGAPTQTATRTLVLIDGRRVVPNTATGLVDLNSIPTSLVERVEVVTGGASAAWGSDAVAGVTNFILKKKLSGFDATLQYGISELSDMRERNLNMSWGTEYAGGRGQIMLAGEYSELDQIGLVGDRDWGDDQWGWLTGSLNGRNVVRITRTGVVPSGVTAGGVIVAGNGAPLPTTGPTSALRGIQFGPGGVPQPFTYGTLLSNNQMIGGSNVSLSGLANIGAPVERKNAYARTTFEFSDSVSGFAEASFADSASVVNTQPMYSPNGDPAWTIQRDNAFLPASIRTTMVANNLTSFAMGRVTPEFGVYSLGSSRSFAKRFAAGLEGRFGDGWRWQASLGAGQTDYFDKALNNVRQANLRAALDSIIGPNGTPICRVDSQLAPNIAITSAANYQGRGAAPGCVPLNPFGPGSISPAAVGYVIGTSSSFSDIDQRTASASINGEPFSTWAGPVSVAGGFDYRRDAVDQTADPVAQFTTPAFQTGGWQFGNRRPLNGAYDVRELFLETVVPLAKDAAWAKTLDLNAAIRTADYSTSGSVTSWKAGLTYEPVGGVLLRATRSRDIRAANLVELFTPGVSIVGAIVDFGRPGNPSLSVPTTTVGNTALAPEEADTTTIGITWQPSFLPGLRASADYYRIDLTDAIGSLGGQNIVNACYGRTPFTVADPSFCSLISRDPATNVITNVRNQTLNLAFVNTQGVDLELSYRMPLANLASSLPGTITMRLLGTYIDKFDNNNGIVTVDRAGEIGNARWRMTGSTAYQNGRFGGYLQARYFDAAKIDNTFGPNDIDNNRVPSRIYVDGSGRYTLREGNDGSRIEVFGNVNNLFDKAPPIVPSQSAGQGQAPLAPDYDRIGRYYSIGVNVHF